MVATVPKAQVGIPAPYSKGLLPILPGGSDAFAQNELDRLRTTIESILIMTPQSATKAPKKLMDGMIRLSRDPWWPVVGQVADAWVYWDAAGQVWRYTSTAPTTT